MVKALRWLKLFISFSHSSIQTRIHTRDMVMEILRIVDPDRVSARRTQRFSRRLYNNKGPNYLVHIDGYDKITPFGFAIHGAICG